MAQICFDANNVDPQIQFEPIPNGKYVAVITESEIKPTASGNGSFLKLTFEVIEGEHDGRKVFARLNLDNPNAQAVAIAQAQLSAICRAVGVMTPRDSEELHNKKLLVTVKVRENKETGEKYNDVSGFGPVELKPVSGTPTSAPTTKPTDSQIPPWKRPKPTEDIPF